MLTRRLPYGNAVAIGLLLAAIVAGTFTALLTESPSAMAREATDVLIVAILTVVLATTRWQSLRRLRQMPRIALAALGFGFLVGPAVAWLIATLAPVPTTVAAGIALFCLFPCTDWFLGFTRLAGGDTETGAALIPVSLVMQIMLFPVAIAVLGLSSGIGTTDDPVRAVLTWFGIPVALAITIRMILRVSVRDGGRLDRVLTALEWSLPVLVAGLIYCIFAANARLLVEHTHIAVTVGIAVLTFFVVMGTLSAAAARALSLPTPGRTLLIVTSSARNAPLMLALTAIAVPDEPVILAVIALGMLIEFPHLIALTAMLRHGHDRETRSLSPVLGTSPTVAHAVRTPESPRTL